MINIKTNPNGKTSNPIIMLGEQPTNPIIMVEEQLINPIIMVEEQLINPIIMLSEQPTNPIITEFNTEESKQLIKSETTTHQPMPNAPPLQMFTFNAMQPTSMIHNGESLTNFDVRIKQITQTIDLTTKKETCSIEVFVSCQNEQKTLCFPKSEYSDLYNKIRKEFPGAYHYQGVSDSITKIREYFAKVYNDSSSIPGITIEKFTNSTFGWGKYKDKIFFGHAGDGISTCKKTLLVVDPNNKHSVLKQALNVLNVAPPPVSLPLFIFSHMGVLRRLWEEAKHPVNFICFILGKTGSYKTSLALELFNIFGDEENKNIINAYSSLPGIERMASRTAKDDFIILDDIRPPLNKSEETMLKNLLESVVRMSGDVSTRCIADITTNDKEKKVVKEAIFVASGEVMFGSLSSMLRILKIELQQDTINKDTLSWLQANKYIYQQYFSLFIRFLEENYNDIVNMLRQKFPKIRLKSAQSFKHARTAEQMAHLEATLDIICLFLHKNQIVLNENIFSSSLILNFLIASEKEMEILSPTKSYLLGLHQLIANKDVVLATTIEDYKNNIQKFIGYYHDNEIWLKHEDIFKAIHSHLAKQNNTIFTTATTIHKELRSSGISVGNKDRNLRRSSITTRPEMLCLSLPRFNEELKKILGD